MMPTSILPIAVVIPTRDRKTVLRRSLESLAAQSAHPAEIVVVDASDDESSRTFCCSGGIPRLTSTVKWRAADTVGAATQRNLGIRYCSQPVIGFMDDDILFEPMCVARLWAALQSDSCIGGVSAMITNQRYHAPGRISRVVFRLMAGQSDASYAGRVLGPAVNLLPEDRDDLPAVVPVDWLNLGCTLYRREALPDPAFPLEFVGYSLMEDLALSLTVGKKWKLANARTARIFHDSQPGVHKRDPALLAEMHLRNRLYVMKDVLGRDSYLDYCMLAIWVAFCHASWLANASGWHAQGALLRGEFRAVLAALSGKGLNS